MHYKFKSLNCNSCAAPLIKKMGSNICKCIYCKNTNLILEDGKTKIIEDVVEPKIAPKQKLSVFSQIILVLGFGLFPFCALLLMKKHKDKENLQLIKGLRITL